jgi:hypothetical protein
LFGSRTIVDPELGALARSRGYWRGAIDVGGHANVPLAVAGGRAAPDPAALAAARQVAGRFASWRADIERALHEHYEPYSDAAIAGEVDQDDAVPSIVSPADVWRHVSLAFVCVAPLGGTITTEIGLSAAWDDEHTLGARFQDGAFLELSGSTLAP